MMLQRSGKSDRQWKILEIGNKQGKYKGKCLKQNVNVEKWEN